MKEYGGFIGLELPKRLEYFNGVPEKDKIRLNCGRSTFYCAVKDLKCKKVYMPYLNCENSVDPIHLAGAEVEYYYLDDDLTPKGINPKDDEAVLWVNYYGNANEIQKEKVRKLYKNLIIDNCHAFFSKPVSGCYNCYSTRKFFGVADGAYLIKEDIKHFDFKYAESADATLFLLQTIEKGTNAVYQENLKNEVRVAKDVTYMSKLTRRILESIDYEEVKEIRNRNFNRLHANLKDLNEFNINLDAQTQMYYPLLVHDDCLRKKLVENHIYTPTWWRHVPEQSGYSFLETELSNYMIMLPVDQRYELSDMDDIAEIVMSLRR